MASIDLLSRSGGLEGSDRETLPTVLDLPFHTSSASFYFLSAFYGVTEARVQIQNT
ncbi:MAG TPA: hypothetical protein VJ225_02280 [Nitrososphaeraceae archaeon]|nr:hypothetical protein [Nitrososphaeraceae archaeon]